MSGGGGVKSLALVEPTDPNDLEAYQDELFEWFLDSFVRTPTHWRGKPVTVTRYPEKNGKGYTFTHLITEDQGWGRELDLERCRRLHWIKALIEAAPDEVLTWVKVDGSEVKLAIALPDFSYIVWLAEEEDRAHLLTAFPAAGQRKRKRLWQEWNRSEKR